MAVTSGSAVSHAQVEAQLDLNSDDHHLILEVIVEPLQNLNLKLI